MESESKGVTVHCERCKSPNVGRDAWACWDAMAQKWALRSIHDHAFCFDCDRDTSLVSCAWHSVD